MLQFKTFEFKADNVKDGIVEGYASTFGNVDLGLDIVVKGAFTKTINEKQGKFPILADHDSTKQIGWNLQASEDSKGLFVKGQIDLNVQLGKERLSLAKTALDIGAPFGLSIGYMTIKAEPDSANPRIRLLKELKLFEYSFVTFPMNTDAMLTAAKSVGEIDKARFLLNHIINEGVSIKDLEIALREEAAKKDYDPAELGQSLDNLIAHFSN
jgi:HK97 family phage prohead protease